MFQMVEAKILMSSRIENSLNVDVADGKDNLNKFRLFIFTQLFGTTFLCVFVT
jgi:hypothetical protein